MRRKTFEEYILSISIINISNQPDSIKKINQEKFKTILKKSIESGLLTITTPYAEFYSKYQDDKIFQEISNSGINKEFLFNEAKLKLKKILDERKNISIEQFKKMLTENIKLETINSETNYKDVKKLIKYNKDYKLIGSSSERKKLIKDYLEEIKKLKSFSEMNSIIISDNSDNKKLHSDFASEEFKNLLKEKIKSEISWEETERKLKDELRWNNLNLNEKQKIEIFKDFIYQMREMRKRNYKILLEEKIGLNQEMTWHMAQHLLQKDERFREVMQKDRELLFQEHMVYVQEKITEEFSQFLEETTLLTPDSATEGIPFKDLINKLNYDLRCQRMFKYPDKRDKLVRNKIKSLKYKFDKQKREENKFLERKRHYDRNADWEKGDIIK